MTALFLLFDIVSENAVSEAVANGIGFYLIPAHRTVGGRIAVIIGQISKCVE